jgi:hypothetical protein
MLAQSNQVDYRRSSAAPSIARAPPGSWQAWHGVNGSPPLSFGLTGNPSLKDCIAVPVSELRPYVVNIHDVRSIESAKPRSNRSEPLAQTLPRGAMDNTPAQRILFGLWSCKTLEHPPPQLANFFDLRSRVDVQPPATRVVCDDLCRSYLNCFSLGLGRVVTERCHDHDRIPSVFGTDRPNVGSDSANESPLCSQP